MNIMYRAKHYVWPCVLIWGLDRLCRYFRYLALSNFHAPNNSPAHVELLSDDTMRITVRRRFDVPMFIGKGWKGWKAGQHMFLAFPTIGPIESHPFTIASICEPLSGTSGGRPTEDRGENQDLRELVWIVRARRGFTRRLKKYALSKNGVCDIPVFMDGPYGAPPDIIPFDTCVFVAGKPL
jgi:ferric-chelate reductase